MGLTLLFCLVAAGPATHPSIAAEYAQLKDPNPSVRRAARQSLLRLSAEDLPTLRQVVAAHHPSPAQVPILREIVSQAVLSSKIYTDQEQRGFLGITLGFVYLREKDGHEAQAVTVESRMPGFVGYRALEDGDVILAVRDSQTQRISNVMELQQAIVRHPAGTRLTLSVLRGGRLVEVPLKLDAMPSPPQQGNIPNLPNMPIDPAQFQAMQAGRLHEAQRYWEERFAPLCR